MSCQFLIVFFINIFFITAAFGGTNDSASIRPIPTIAKTLQCYGSTVYDKRNIRDAKYFACGAYGNDFRNNSAKCPAGTVAYEINTWVYTHAPDNIEYRCYFTCVQLEAPQSNCQWR